MYFGDHPPPHFHAVYDEYEAKVSIASLKVVEGTMPRRALRLIKTWGVMHRQELLVNWDRAQRRESLAKIEPLP